METDRGENSADRWCDSGCGCRNITTHSLPTSTRHPTLPFTGTCENLQICGRSRSSSVPTCALPSRLLDSPVPRFIGRAPEGRDSVGGCWGCLLSSYLGSSVDAGVSVLRHSSHHSSHHSSDSTPRRTRACICSTWYVAYSELRARSTSSYGASVD